MRIVLVTLGVLFSVSICYAGFADGLAAGMNAGSGYNSQQQQQQVIINGNGNIPQVYNALNNMNSIITQLQYENKELRDKLYQIQQRLTNLEMQVWDK